MVQDTGNREDPFQVDNDPIAEKEEAAVELFGWCSDCKCESGYHLGADTGECIDCGCLILNLDINADLLHDTIEKYLLPELEPDSLEQYTPDPTEHDISMQVVELVVHDTGPAVTYSSVVFMGKASRSCKQCGEVKLYKEFSNSDDPQKLCGLCEEWKDQEDALEYLTDDERAEIEALENDIIEAEEEYEDVWERQHMIDEVLRELDE
jgi:hypothetical protein